MNIKKFNLLLLFLIAVAMLIGCNKDISKEDKKIEKSKSYYLEVKSKLLEVSTFNNREDIPFDITTSIDRVNDEEVSYKVKIDNTKEDLYDVKAMVVHNYYTEDIFPSIGLFDDKEDLLVNDQSKLGLELIGTIKTTKDIKDLNLEFKIWVQYKDNDNDGNIKDIYYKTT